MEGGQTHAWGPHGDARRRETTVSPSLAFIHHTQPLGDEELPRPPRQAVVIHLDGLTLVSILKSP